MRKETNLRNVFWVYLVIASFISAINILFEENAAVSSILVLFEFFFLIRCAVKRDFKTYICLYIVFLSGCLEFSYLAGTDVFFNIKSIRFFGISVSTLLLMPLVVYGIFNFFVMRKAKKHASDFFVGGLILLNMMALVVGLLLFFTNDNNIASMDNALGLFMGEIYEALFIPLAFGLTLPSFLENKAFRSKFFIVLQAVMVGLIFQVIIAISFKQYGFYGDLNTLQVSTCGFYIPFLMLTLLKKERFIFPYVTALMALVCTIMLLYFNGSGKLIITTIVTFVILLVSLILKCSFRKKMLVLLSIGAFVALFIYVYPFLFGSDIFRSKLGQVLGLFDFTSGTWLESMPESPRIRIEELRSVLIEFGRKPYLAFFGKGFLGTINDNTGYFYANVTNPETFVSEIEWKTGLFYNLHEANSFLLRYGFVGIVFFIATCLKTIKSYFKTYSLFAVIGLVWFLFFYGYSFVLGVFGFSAFICGLNSPKVPQKTAPKPCFRCIELSKKKCI